MADLPRLNNIIRALEAGQHALTCFAPAHVNGDRHERSKFDGCVFEMEHNPGCRRLRDCLQYISTARQIAPVRRSAGDAAGGCR
jgi:4-hydroxy-2-oxoheptanedioate aldolase